MDNISIVVDDLATAIAFCRTWSGTAHPQYSLEQSVSALSRLALDESEKSKIRYENARALFGLP